MGTSEDVTRQAHTASRLPPLSPPVQAPVEFSYPRHSCGHLIEIYLYIFSLVMEY